MPWYPRSDQYYHEPLGRKEVIALGSEYIDFSIPASAGYKAFPPAVYYDVFTDSAAVRPHLQTYADELQQYYDNVIAMRDYRDRKNE
jgi:hypothetical protein